MSYLKSKGFLVSVCGLYSLNAEQDIHLMSEKIKEKEKRLKQKINAFVIAFEKTNDVNQVNLHFAISFLERRAITDKYWDFLLNTEKTKINIKKIVWNKKHEKTLAFQYVKNCGVVNICNFAAQEIIESFARKFTGNQLTDYITSLIEGGSSLLEIQTHHLLEVRSYAREKKSKVIEGIKTHRLNEYIKTNRNLPALLITIDENYSNQQKEILNWFEKIRVYKSNWPLKESCILIVGGPNMGKTTFIKKISEHVTTYYFPSTGWFLDYENNFYDLIVWEEPKFGFFNIEFLKLFLQGFEVDLQIKGDMATKKDNPLICINSNETLKKLFTKSFLNSKQQEHCNNGNEDDLCNCSNRNGCPVWDEKVNFQAIRSRVKQYILEEPLFPLLDAIK